MRLHHIPPSSSAGGPYFVVTVLPLPKWKVQVYKVWNEESPKVPGIKRKKTHPRIQLWQEEEISEASVDWVGQLFSVGLQDNVLLLNFFGRKSAPNSSHHDAFVLVCKFFGMAVDGECQIGCPIYLDLGQGPVSFNIDHSVPDMMLYLMSATSYHTSSAQANAGYIRNCDGGHASNSPVVSPVAIVLDKDEVQVLSLSDTKSELLSTIQLSTVGRYQSTFDPQDWHKSELHVNGTIALVCQNRWDKGRGFFRHFFAMIRQVLVRKI